MNKTILHRVQLLQLKREEPVKIWDLYRMPDGSEQRMRWKGNHEQMRSWLAATGAEHTNVIIEVKEGG